MDKFVKTGGSDGNSGNSWAEAYATIQKGIDEAHATGGGTVRVEVGRYSEDIELKSRVTVQGEGAMPVLPPDPEAVPCDPNNPGIPIIAGSGRGPVVTIHDVEDVKVIRFLITGGKNRDYGGGVSIKAPTLPSGSVDVEECCIQDNFSREGGGGVGITDVAPSAMGPAGARVRIRYCIINDNSCYWRGGGVYASKSENVHVRENLILRNHGDGGAGGVFYHFCAESRIIANRIQENTIGTRLPPGGPGGISFNLFNQNFYGCGGGILLFACREAPATVSIEDNDIQLNMARHRGGGVAVLGGSYVNFSGRNRIRSNIAGTDGGGVAILNSRYRYRSIALALFNHEVCNMTGALIEGNSAGDDGGGIYMSVTGILNVENTTIQFNTAENNGGGCHATINSFLNIGDNTIIKGNQVLSAGGRGGGGIYIRNANLEVQGSGIEIIENRSAGHGGGLYLHTERMGLLFENYMRRTGFRQAQWSIRGKIKIASNEATRNGGGLWAGRQARSRQGILNVRDGVALHHNLARVGNGGGAYVERLNALRFWDLQGVNNNRASHVFAAFSILFFFRARQIRIGGAGGGLYFEACNGVDIRRITADGIANNLSVSGAGLQMSRCSIISVRGNRFVANQANQFSFLNVCQDMYFSYCRMAANTVPTLVRDNPGTTPVSVCIFP